MSLLSYFRREPDARLQEIAALESQLDQKLTETRHAYEAIQQLSSYVNVELDRLDPDGTIWTKIGGGVKGESPNDKSNYADEDELTKGRDYCKKIARENPYAINILENLVNYIVGEGHRYSGVAKKGRTVDEGRLNAFNDALQELIEDQLDWAARQQEIVVRLHRDGEVFIRKFVDGEKTYVRFIEPYRVQKPLEHPADTFGIKTDSDDVETVLGYHIAPLDDGGEWEFVPAEEVQHRKVNVDSNVKRGVPTLLPIAKILDLVDVIHKNIAVMSNIQTKIAMIRRTVGLTKAGAERQRASAASWAITDQRTGKVEYLEDRKRGAIIDVNADVEHDFPPSPEMQGWLDGIGSLLRSVAARMCFPEFMLTSDASNSNYSSTMVAEGPAVRAFQRRQASMKNADLKIIKPAMLALGFDDVMTDIEIQCEPPTVEVRDEKAEADTNKVYVDMGVMSKQTVSSSIGLDYKQEQKNIEQHEKDHPDQMQQAELQLMQSQAIPTPDAANKSGRGKAMEGVRAALESYVPGGGA